MTIKDQAEDIIDGIKDRLDGDHCHHHPEHVLAEKAKEKVKEFTEKYDPVSRLILESGGIFPFARKLKNGEIKLPELSKDDLLGKPLMACIGNSKPWVGRDGLNRTSFEAKAFKVWENAKTKTILEDLPF